MPPPRLQDTTRLQNSCPLRNQRGQHCVHCARGITGAPVHQTNWIGDHYHPEGAARCAPIVPLPPIRNNRPLRNEGALTANAVRSQPQARAVTPRFYPVFTPLLPRFYPVLLRFYPTFTPFLPQFYPSFTPFLPYSASSFYPTFTPFLPSFYPVPLRRFYPRFTPFLPHLRRVKCQTYPVFTPLLPHRQFSPLSQYPTSYHTDTVVTETNSMKITSWFATTHAELDARHWLMCQGNDWGSMGLSKFEYWILMMLAIMRCWWCCGIGSKWHSDMIGSASHKGSDQRLIQSA